MPNGSAMNPMGLGAVSQHQTMPLSEKGPMTPMKLLRWKAQGTIPAEMPREVAQKAYKYLLNHPHMQFKVSPEGNPALWLTNTDYEYLLGTNGRGTAVSMAIDTASNGCYVPITVHTDKHKNAWVACEEANPDYNGGEQEYTDAGALVGTYSPSSGGGCPASSYCYSYAFDGGISPDGKYVAVEQSLGYTFYCTSYYCYFEYLSPGVFVWKTASGPSGTPTFTPISSFGDPAYYMYYMAWDSSDNIWFDYYGYASSECCFGIGEIAGAGGSSPTVHFIKPPGTLNFAGGVQVVGSNAYVTDQGVYCANIGRTTSEYALPITPSGNPTHTYGPTAVGISGCGDPVSGGFNRAGSYQAQGDAVGWSDLTKILGNVNSATWNIDDPPALEGAAYASSGQP